MCILTTRAALSQADWSPQSLPSAVHLNRYQNWCELDSLVPYTNVNSNESISRNICNEINIHPNYIYIGMEVELPMHTFNLDIILIMKSCLQILVLKTWNRQFEI
jgi:hypothetical protein